MEGTLGFVEVDLEARFPTIRTQETNLGKKRKKKKARNLESWVVFMVIYRM